MRYFDFNRIKKVVGNFKNARVAVVGDLILDEFIWGDVSRISPEAPVPVVWVKNESFMPGGAANVARNLVSLAVPAELFGAVGNDDAGRKLQKLLVAQNIGCSGLVKNAARHTSVKTRIVAHQQQVVRVDRETCAELDGPATERVMAAIEAGKETMADARKKLKEAL